MALLYVDPFENGAVGVNLNAEPNSKIFNEVTIRADNGTNGYVRLVAGALSNKAVLCYKNWNGAYFGNFEAYKVPQNYSRKIIIGFALSVSGNVNNTASSFMPNDANVILSFSSHTSSRLKVTPNWALSLGSLTTEPNILIDSVYSYLEVAVDFSTGDFDLFVNNVLIGTGTMTLSSVRYIYFGPIGEISGFVWHFYDDIYILDDTGTTHNQRLGPVRAVRVPFNSITESNFTPFGAADNITAINKDSPNDSTFNRSPVSNNVGDYFKLDTSVLPSDRPIIAVQQSAMYRKTDIGERALKLVVKESTDRKEHLLPERLATFSGGPAQILETSADGSAWDITNLAATDFGYEAS